MFPGCTAPHTSPVHQQKCFGFHPLVPWPLQSEMSSSIGTPNEIKRMSVFGQCVRKSCAPGVSAIAQRMAARCSAGGHAGRVDAARTDRGHRARASVGLPSPHRRILVAFLRERRKGRHGIASLRHVRARVGAFPSGGMSWGSAAPRKHQPNTHARRAIQGSVSLRDLGGKVSSSMHSRVANTKAIITGDRCLVRGKQVACSVACARCFREKISVDHSPPWLPPPERRGQGQTHLTRMN